MHLPRFLTHNLTWKVIALVSATLVWMTLKSSTPPRIRSSGSRTFRQIPVSVMTSGGDRGVIRTDPAAVDVEVRGAPEALPRLRARDLRAFVDLTAAADPYRARLRVEVHTPAGISVEKVTPAEVTGGAPPPPSPSP